MDTIETSNTPRWVMWGDMVGATTFSAADRIARLRAAAAAIALQDSHHSHRTAQGLPRFIPRLPLALVPLLVVLICLSALSTPEIPAAPAPPELDNTVLCPTETRTRIEHASRIQESLGRNIRGYYRRIPGGFERALRLADQSAASHPLSSFPSLRYEALDREVQTVFMTSTQLLDDHAAAAAAERVLSTILGRYFPDSRIASVLTGLSPASRQEVLEHELTHAWQYASCEPAEDPERWSSRFSRPLGDEDVLGKLEHSSYVRFYLCRPIEIDPRLAALKRWCAWNHGQLLDTPEKIREMMENPRPGSLSSWRDVCGAWQIWHSYRNQPDVQEQLIQRLLQLL